ncbi:hypothetical protein FTUN_1590 [Frigoriglobus tundricola]|uniref:Uncharacterized protein n=1 Tax=Frigoriglobus tundricola TaxID=2774151 RepID=A0A6M5YLC3_9BACT|nr:hypothetical protein FTUN_1590 [Frigoriglobus tundricola]
MRNPEWKNEEKRRRSEKAVRRCPFSFVPNSTFRVPRDKTRPPGFEGVGA